jgi:cytidylate kinase
MNPYREFAREQQLRFERLMADMRRRDDEDRKIYIARFDAMQDDMRELRAESRAVMQALLKVIDRLDNGGGPAPAT